MNQKNQQGQPVKVIIYGQEYPIRARGGEEYINKVARFVDDRMAQVAEITADKSVARLAILAALNITDELFTAQTEKERIISEYEARARDISDSLDRELKGL